MLSKNSVRVLLSSFFASSLVITSAFATPLEEQDTSNVIISSYGDVTISDTKPILSQNANNFAAASALPAAWTDYIQYNSINRLFINYTFECRIAVMFSSNTDGYFQLFNHRVEGFSTFGNPPTIPPNGNGSYSTGAVTTISCDQTPPGISY
jgi:hypothetical protein